MTSLFDPFFSHFRMHRKKHSSLFSVKEQKANKMAAIAPQVRVGIGCFVRNTLLNRQQVLVGVRKGSHGAGRLALPGGHLELGESWEGCIARELREEANLDIENIKFLKATNDICIDGNPSKHYITIFMQADISSDSPPLSNNEPHKCEAWQWMNVQELQQMSEEDPRSMFEPLLHFFENDGAKTLLVNDNNHLE